MSKYARMRPLTPGHQGQMSPLDLESTVRRMSEQLGAAGERGTLRLAMGDNDGNAPREVWDIALVEGTARSGEHAGGGDVEVLTAPATFAQFADGSYSPVQAFLDGKLRIRGDVDVAKRLLRHLAGPEGRVDCW